MARMLWPSETPKKREREQQERERELKEREREEQQGKRETLQAAGIWFKAEGTAATL